MQLAEKFSRPIVCFVDTPAAYPGHRVGGARRRRGDRPEPARDGRARRADRRRRPRRGRQRRRAGHRRRRPRPDARVRHLQRDSARRLRGDPVARRQPQGAGGRGAQDHRARPARRSASSTTSSPSRSAARTPPRRPPASCSTPRWPRRWPRSAALRRRGRGSSSATRSSARWARSGSWKADRVGAAPPALESRAPATRRPPLRLTAELGLSPVVARLLAIRGHHDPDQAARFLRPSLDHLLDPVAAGRHGAGGRAAAAAPSPGASGSSSTATTTSTASPPR